MGIVCIIIETYLINEFENEDDCFFMFFRSIVSDLFFPPVFEVLLIGEKKIECVCHSLISEEVRIEEKNTCKCHSLKVIEKESANFVCSATGKKIGKTGITSCRFLGEYKYPHSQNDDQRREHFEDDDGEEESNIISVIARIDVKAVSQTYIFGTEKIMTSNSQLFARLINEMRSGNDALIAKRNKSNVFGGEYFLIIPDMIHMFLHIRKLANRSQIIKFDETAADCDSHCEVFNEPILPTIKHIDDIAPFNLGRSNIIPF